MTTQIKTICELVSQCLYDQMPVRPNDSHHFFSWPVGMGNPIKTFLHTNQLMMLDTPTVFQATRLNALFLKDGVPISLYETRLYGKTHVEFIVFNKIYWSGPAWLCASPFAIFQTPSEELPTLREKYGIVWERIGAYLGDVVFGRDNPNARYTGVMIGQEAFQVRAHIHSSETEGLDLAIHLDGTCERAII